MIDVEVDVARFIPGVSDGRRGRIRLFPPRCRSAGDLEMRQAGFAVVFASRCEQRQLEAQDCRFAVQHCELPQAICDASAERSKATRYSTYTRLPDRVIARGTCGR